MNELQRHQKTHVQRVDHATRMIFSLAGSLLAFIILMSLYLFHLVGVALPLLAVLPNAGFALATRKALS
jgi:hypothetical protein